MQTANNRGPERVAGPMHASAGPAPLQPGGSTSSQPLEPPPADAPRPKMQIAGQDASRVGAALWILACLFGIWYSAAPEVWLLLLAPSLAGALWPLIRHTGMTSKTNLWEERLRAGHERVSLKTGKFARYFTKPLLAGILFIWRKTAPVGDIHLRAGLRVTGGVYFAGVMVALLAAVLYVAVAVVVAIAVLLLMLWFLGRVLSGESSGGRVSYITRVGTDWLGRKKEEHFDAGGRKVGESRETTDFFGRPKVEHLDAGGRKTGESKPDTDFFGSPKVVNYDADGQKTGESRPTTDFFGGPKVEHFDDEGRKIGESRPDTDFFGQPTVRHEMKKEEPEK